MNWNKINKAAEEWLKKVTIAVGIGIITYAVAQGIMTLLTVNRICTAVELVARIVMTNLP